MTANRCRRALAALLALPLSLLGSQETARAQELVEVSRAVSPVRVDGMLEEPAWEQAAAIPLAHEWFPGDNVPAPVATTALVTYDDERLYVAFRAADPDPSKIRARFADRDAAFDDDTVGIMIDPFHDGRRAFQFQVNPLGAQMDAVNSDVEGTEDFSWDAIWESAGRITAEGYVVEIAIPFRQLRFPASGQPQTWGFLAMRDWPRSLRHRMRSIVTDQDRNCLVCQFQEISGLQRMETGRNLEVTPTLTGNISEEREAGGSFESAGDELEPGVSARWGVTPNVALNLTVNPDFSQVEADAAQLDVNERFALFFPEKRPFFLEGADFFETQFPLVFTRTVADPVAGLKVTGKQDANAFGAFFAEDRINNLILPGSQSSRLVTIDQDVTSGALRYRRDLGKTSTLGVLWAGREGEDYRNHVAGIDGVYRFTASDLVRYQVAGSTTDYPDAFARERRESVGSFDGHALAATYRHSDRNWSWATAYNELHPGFRGDSGFIDRVGVRSGQAWAERRIRGQEGGWFSNLYVYFGADGTREYNGAFNEWGSDLVLTYQGPRQSTVSLGIAPNQEHFQDATYHNTRYSIAGEMQPSGDSTVGLAVRWGEAIDFVNNRQGDFVTISPSMDVKLGRRFQGNLGWDHQVFDVQGGRLFKVDLAQTRLLYHFNGRSFLRAILQYEWLERDPDLYTVDVDRKMEELLSQLLFSYRLNAQTVLLVGYSDFHQGVDAIDLTQTERTVFLKLGYAFLF
ncbi:MAG TPA: sugar-binding protein [Thermoanaerobaculia bacterium]